MNSYHDKVRDLEMRIEEQPEALEGIEGKALLPYGEKAASKDVTNKVKKADERKIGGMAPHPNSLPSLRQEADE